MLKTRTLSELLPLLFLLPFVSQSGYAGIPGENDLNQMVSDAISKVGTYKTTPINLLEETKFQGVSLSIDSLRYIRGNDVNGVKGKNMDVVEDVSTWSKSWSLKKEGKGFRIITDNGNGKELGVLYEDKIVAPARKTGGESGNALLNRVPLMKNMKYEVDGIEYVTDNMGRVESVTADLDDFVRVRLGNQQIRAVDIKDGIGGDQGGHLIASRFYGPGEQINLFPQSSTLNQGKWKSMENLWANAMSEGMDVKVKIKVKFDGDSKRPSGYEVDYWIDGDYNYEKFSNL